MNKLIRDEMDYQQRRFYRRLKMSGELVVEFWPGAKKFLNSIPGIVWKQKGNKILIQERVTKMKTLKTFRDILNEHKLIEGTWELPFKMAQAKKLAKLMKNPIPTGDAGTEMLKGLIGDDGLFDDIQGSTPLGKKDDVRDLIRNWIADTLGDYKSNPDSFKDKLDAGAEKILRKI